MFDIGWSEMAIVLLVALIVIGPKDLPRLARNMGQWTAKVRAMAREFHRALEDMAREAELDKVKSEIEKAGRTDLGRSIEKTIDPSGELSRALEPPVLDGKPAEGAQPAGAPATPAIAATAPVQAQSSVAPGAPAHPATATAAPTQPQSSVATGAPTGPAAPAVAPAAPVGPATSVAASNGAGAATPRKRARRAPVPKATAAPEPSAPGGNGTGSADQRKARRRATAPTESS
jgi:sec-independent protein translocase protein TatB